MEEYQNAPPQQDPSHTNPNHSKVNSMKSTAEFGKNLDSQNFNDINVGKEVNIDDQTEADKPL